MLAYFSEEYGRVMGLGLLTWARTKPEYFIENGNQLDKQKRRSYWQPYW